MAELKFQVPDAVMEDLVEAWSAGWTPEVNDPEDPNGVIPNPLNKQQFAKAEIKKMIAQRIKQRQVDQLPDIEIT